MELEEYLAGAVAAEMPASFDPEALKAQSRCFAHLHAAQGPGSGGEGCRVIRGGSLQTQLAVRPWEDNRQALEKWPPEDAPHYLEKIREAVSLTGGLY